MLWPPLMSVPNPGNKNILKFPRWFSVTERLENCYYVEPPPVQKELSSWILKPRCWNFEPENPHTYYLNYVSVSSHSRSRLLRCLLWGVNAETWFINTDNTYHFLSIIIVFFMHYLCISVILQELNNRFFFFMQPVFQNIVQYNLNKTRHFSP